MKGACLASLLLPFAWNASAASTPDFSGVWKLDTLRSALAGSGYKEFAIFQSASEIRVGYQDETLTYMPGAEKTLEETNAGIIPGFARKVTTRADWDGTKLILRATRFNETTDPKTGIIQTNRIGMFTRVIALTLAAGGREMTVESTGYREMPPPTLHGLPYNQKTDPIYRKFVEVFRKTE